MSYQGWMKRFGQSLPLAITAWLLVGSSAFGNVQESAPELRVLCWNIWHGGREDGETLGPKRVVEVIRESGADIVAMQETYGSGEIIAEALGFHFQPRGTNLSIHSRYPIIEDISVFEPFKCVGAVVELPGKRRIAFYSIWLPYDAEIWEAGTRDTEDPESMLAACQSSARDLALIWSAIRERLSGSEYAGVPVFVGGDFNSMSHLDYADVARDQYGVVLDWPTSQVLSQAGFRDAYRDCNPVIDRSKDSTWTPRFPEQEQDRIDYLYYLSEHWQAVDARVIKKHAESFPSDHAALLTRLQFHTEAAPQAFAGRAVSYNIKHGQGNDQRVDLARIAGVLAPLEADFIGLQEVDDGAKRSASVNQARELGRQLKMHAAFGPFMDHDGGRYGLALLSRHPIVSSRSLRLPEGNEPRVALVADVRLPNGELLTLVNVHFDWVQDDGFRYAQASRVADFLRELQTPYLLLGDFNDQPASRTLALFHALAAEAKKPADDRFSFSSSKPEREIDFLFGSPKGRWKFGDVRLLDEALASDHRPLLVDFRLTP